MAKKKSRENLAGQHTMSNYSMGISYNKNSALEGVGGSRC